MKRKKVLVGGVFQIIHPGHLYLLEQAKKLGDVYVVVARDSNTKKKLVVREGDRVKLVKSLFLVKTAVLGSKNDFFKIVYKLKPDFILLGPDQTGLRELQNLCKMAGLKTKVRKLRKRKTGFGSRRLISRL